jgi:glyoxylase-like metal-dependent hydrolase (beta-lactamase superfamily II)
MTDIAGWNTVAREPLVLVREYSFGAGMANTLAVALPDRKWMLVSPPIGVAAEELKSLEQHGDVVALLEFNGAHHMGLAPCGAAFPRAISYATERAAARIRKKTKQPGRLEPIDRLRPLLGDRISILPVPGDKIGDVLVRVQTEKGTLLYTGDFIANIPRLPRNPIARLMFKLTDSGPGFKVFGIFFKFFIADKTAARDFLIHEVENNPPSIVVPGHGDVVARDNLGPTVASMLRAAF